MENETTEGQVSPQEMPTFAALYAFIRDEYLHSRFEAVNDCWPLAARAALVKQYPNAKHPPLELTHAEGIVHGYMETLEADGVALISMYESRRGRMIEFDRSLRILNADEPPAQMQKRAPSLSNPAVGNW